MVTDPPLSLDRPPDPGVDHESSTNHPEVAPRDGLSDLGTTPLMDLGGSQGLSSAPGGSGEPRTSTRHDDPTRPHPTERGQRGGHPWFCDLVVLGIPVLNLT